MLGGLWWSCADLTWLGCCILQRNNRFRLCLMQCGAIHGTEMELNAIAKYVRLRRRSARACAHSSQVSAVASSRHVVLRGKIPSTAPSVAKGTRQLQGCVSFPAQCAPNCHVAYIKVKPPAIIIMATSQILDFTETHTAAESFTSSTRPINNNSYSTPGERSTTATMSDTNGKAPLSGAGGPARDPNEPIIKVQPPRREDLQPSYARVLKPDDADADTNGWYGSMVC